MPVSWHLSLILVAACGSNGTATGNGDAGSSTGDDASSPMGADANRVGDDDADAFDAPTADGPAGSDGPTELESGPGDAGAFACGDAMCAAGQLCVHPCCGGAAPSCLMPLPATGTCPNNLVEVSACSNMRGPGCEAPPCTPPPPFCIDGASQCANACGCTNPTCGECPPASGQDVMCRCG